MKTLVVLLMIMCTYLRTIDSPSSKLKPLTKSNSLVKRSSGSRTQLLERSQSQIPHTRPETPRSVTHNHDEDYSDEESDSKSLEEKAG